MSQMETVGVVVGYLLGGLGAIGGLQYCKYRYERHVSHRSFFKVFPVISPQRLAVVCPTQPDREGFHHPEIHDDLVAATVVASALQRNGTQFDIRLSSQVTETERLGSMFLICGPVGNKITGDILKEVLLPLRFDKGADGRYRIVDGDGQTAHGPQGASHDYALIAKVRNPWADQGDAYIYVAAGIGRLGTQGAARLLCEETKLITQRLHEKSHTALCFVGVVECKGDYKGLSIASHILRLVPL